jgi:hypothetical protein
MAQAGKLFDKKNGGAGAGNQAAKVDGPSILTHTNLPLTKPMYCNL